MSRLAAVRQNIGDRWRRRFLVWALRRQPPEPAPIVLGQRRVYVLPTRAGLAYAASLLVMLVGAINYNLSLGYVLCFLLGGLGVATILHTFRNLVGLRLRPGRCEPVFAGGVARFSVLADNRRDEARWSLAFSLPGQPDTRLDLAPAASEVATLACPAERRGWLAMPRLRVATTYPLGLVRAWSYAAPDQRCLVYPTPAAQAPPLPFAAGRDDGLDRGGPGADDFFGLRRHHPGDSPRQVAWKTVARHDGPLLTKEFAAAAERCIVLDWDDLPALPVEQRLSVLCRWVCQANADGAPWSLRLPGRTLPPGAGSDHYHACLKALALHGDAD